MNKCIYTGQDDSTATFSAAEHIIPKCIGGIRCLPKGWVSDEINNRFSALELGFARENPIVALHKMFGPDIGRKNHQNRYKVGLFSDRDNLSELSLGYVKNGTPFSLNQVVFSNFVEESIDKPIEIKIIVSPSKELTYEQLIEMFWNSIKQYNGCPSCIKDKRIPQHTYILGVQDRRWFLGISNTENPETIKPLIMRAIQKLINHDVSEFINSCNGIKSSSNQVNIVFSICFNYLDCFRVYAKIALNCLAFLKGQDYTFLSEFDSIKEAILKGKDILNYVWISEGNNPVIPLFESYSDKIVLGENAILLFS